MKIKLHTLLILLLVSFVVKAQQASVNGFNQVKMNQNTNEKFLELQGAMTYVGNSVVKRQSRNSTASNNSNVYLEYINIDPSGVAVGESIYNSSSSSLALPRCANIKYVGLYWTGLYPSDDFSGNGQTQNWEQIQFKMPGEASYTAIQKDKVLLDHNHTAYVNKNENHYVCYADITNRVNALSNSNGEYFGANIASAMQTNIKSSSLGTAAGWSMVVVYEDLQNGLSRYFTVFHGHADIRKANSQPYQDIVIEGFKTIPPKPNGDKVQVNVDLLVAALEGDQGIPNDTFRVLRDDFEQYYPNGLSTANFRKLKSTNNSSIDNFFDSTLTLGNDYLENSQPAPNSAMNPEVSKNSMGIDAHMFRMQNDDNKYVKNNDTKAIFRFDTDGDTYFPFLMVFSVEIIKPIVTITNTVHSGGTKFGADNPNAGNLSSDYLDPVTGEPNKVKLGESFYYDLCFENHSTEPAANIKITDQLPFGVSLVRDDANTDAVRPLNINGAPNLTQKFNIEFSSVIVWDESSGASVDPAKVKFINYKLPTATEGGILEFLLGDDLGDNEAQGKPNCLRLKVELDKDCTKFTSMTTTSCSGTISNHISADYIGPETGNITVGQTSYDSFNLCEAPSDTNFLIDRGECLTNPDIFAETFVCVGGATTITAGTGFSSYQWYKKNTTGNFVAISGATSNTYVINGSSSSLGLYQVKKTNPSNAACGDGEEFIKVTEFASAPNPFKEASLVPASSTDPREEGTTICASEPTSSMSEFYLCGNSTTGSGSKTIILAYGASVNVKWEKLTNTADPSLIPDQNTTCAALPASNGWTWSTLPVSTGNASGPLGTVDSKKFKMTTAGEFRVKVSSSDNSCNKYYYFRVFNADFQPEFGKLDKLCSKKGYIQIKDISDLYQTKLEKNTGASTWVIISDWTDVPTGSTTKGFDIDVVGKYRYQVQLKDQSHATCPFISKTIEVGAKNFTVGIKKGDVTCSLATGSPKYTASVRVSPDALDTTTSYVYELYESLTTAGLPSGAWETDTSPTPTTGKIDTRTKTYSAGTTPFEDWNITPGSKYKIVVTATTTKLDVTKKCRKVEVFDFAVPQPLTLTATRLKNISCKDKTSPAIVQLAVSGGPANPSNTTEVALVTNPGSGETIGTYTAANLTDEIAFDSSVQYPATYRYKFSVNGVNYCPVSKDIIVDVDPPFEFKVTPVDAICSTGNKGKITVKLTSPTTSPTTTSQIIQYELVSASGGNDIAYNATPVSYAGVKTIPNLEPDTYTVNIKVWKDLVYYNKYKNDPDVNKYVCTYTYTNKIIKASIPVTNGNAVGEDARCDTQKGKITFTAPTTGVSPYTYFIYKNNTTNIAGTGTTLVFNLVPGTYDCVIIDKNGCKKEINDVVVADEPTPPNFTTNVTYDGCNGLGIVKISPFANNYTYKVKKKTSGQVIFPVTAPGTTPTLSNGTLSGVPVGEYTVDVTYANGCTKEGIPFKVEKEKGITVSVSDETPVKCSGNNDGKATLTVTNFDTTFWYKNTSDTSVTSATASNTSPVVITGIPGGSNVFEVYYKDPAVTANAQCKTSATVVIPTSPTLLAINTISPITLPCGVGLTAEVTPGASGGTTPYVYAIAASPTSTSTSWETMTGTSTSFTKPAGTYIIRVTDKYNCVKKTTFTIINSAPPIFTLDEVECANRYGDGADIKVTLSGNTTPAAGYQYQISTNSTASGAWIDLPNFSATSPYITKITTGSVANIDNYVHIRVKGSSNTCSGEQHIFIEDTLSFSATTTPPSFCNKKQAEILISAEKGGAGSYQFTLVKTTNPLTVPALTDYNALTNSKIIVPVADIAVGTTQSFDVYMKDSNNCTTKIPYSITRPKKIVVVIDKIFTACSSVAPKIKIKTLNQGNGPYTVKLYEVSAPTTSIGSLTSVPVIAAGSPLTTFTGASNKSYFVIATDKDGCPITSNTIKFDQLAVLNATLGTIIKPVCPTDKGIININKPNPPSAVAIANGGNYVYTLINVTDATNPVELTPVTSAASPVELTAPSEGKYKIKISEVSTSSTSGCPQTLGPVTINALLDPLPTYKTPTISYACDGKATIKVDLKDGVTIPTGVKLTYVLDDFTDTSTNTDHHGEFVVDAGVNTYKITVVYTMTGQTVTGPIASIKARTPCTNEITVKTENVKFASSIVSFTNVKCRDTATGTILFNATDYGTSFFYKYLKPNTSTWINGTSTTSTETIINLPAGITKIKVYRTAADRTANNCGKDIEQKIANPAVLSITVKVKPMQCDNPKEATLTATAVGGWSNYAYSISSDYVAPATVGGLPVNAGSWTASTANSFKKLEGTYFIKVTDTNGCEVISTAQKIEVAKNLVIQLVHTGDKCAPYGIDGDVRIILRNGEATQNYEYTIGTGSAAIPFTFVTTAITNPNGSVGSIQAFDILTGTVVGTNSIKVRNKDTGCSSTKTIEIKKDLTVKVTPINPTSCSKGNFKFQSISGGEATYTYQVTETATEPAATTFTAVPANGILFKPIANDGYTFTGTSKIYYIWVKDKNGCVKNVNKTLTKKADLAIAITPVQKVCSGDNAILKITVTGGSANYKVEVYDKADLTTPIFAADATNTNLTDITNLEIDVTTKVPVAGKTFIVKVTDNDQCYKKSTDQVMVYGSNVEPTMKLVLPLCQQDKGLITITNPSIVSTVLNHATGPFEYTLTMVATTANPSVPVSINKGTTLSDNLVLTTTIEVSEFGTYKLSVKDKGVDANSSQCPFTFNEFVVEPNITMPLFQLKTLSYLCDGTVDIKIEPNLTTPSAAANYATALADGVTFHYILKNEPFISNPNPNSSFTANVNPNTTGEFNVPSLTKNYTVDIIYLKAGVTFDPNNINNYPCGNLGNVVVKVLKDKQFTAKYKGKTPQVCKGDNNSGTATFDVSNFSVNTTTGNYFYKKMVPGTTSFGAAVSSTDNVLTVTGLPLGNTTFVFAPTVADFTNGHGCMITIVVDIKEPAKDLLLPIPAITNIKCTQTGHTLATITPTATGGTPNPDGYKYYIKKTTDTAWGTTASATFTKPVGTDEYEIKVVDSAGCEKISPSFKIEAPETPSFTLTEEKCGYGANAKVKITNISTTQNTTTEYQYQIVGQTSWTTFTFLADNTYIVQTGVNVGVNKIKVRNKTTLCYSDKDITIVPVLSFTVENVTPSSCDVGGFKVLTNTGGHPNPDYTFAIVKSSPATVPNVFAALDSAGIVKIPSGIAPGYGASETYIVWMKDSKGCTKKIDPITLTRDLKLNIAVALKQPECFGKKGKLTYTITGGKSDYSAQLKITDAGGVTTNVAGPSSLVVSSTGVNVIFDVDPGKYNVVVTDARTCKETSVTSTIITGKKLNGSVGIPTQPTCLVNTGSIVFVAPTVTLPLPVGTSTPDYGYYLEECTVVVDNSVNPTTYTYTTKVNPTVIDSSSPTMTNIPPGAYFPIIKDKSVADGCPQRLDGIIIKALPTKVLEFDTSISYDCEGKPTLTITPKAGSKPSDIKYFTNPYSYSYTVKGATPVIAPVTSTAGTGVASIVLPVGDFDYAVDVENGIAGCITTNAFTVDVDLDKFNVSKIEPTAVTCHNGDDGKLKITIVYPNPNMDSTTAPTAPVAGFFYRKTTTGVWLPQIGNVLELTGLSPGQNTVYISYDKTTSGSCAILKEETIPNVPELKITNVQITKGLSCNPSGVFSAAELNVTTQGIISGRTYKYSVLKETAPSTYTFISDGNLSTIYIGEKGTYKIKIKDDSLKGCEAEYLPVVIKDPGNVEFILSKSCFDQANDGTITIVTGSFATPTVLSGLSFQIKKDAGSFTTVIPNAVTSPINGSTFKLSNLKPGNYHVKVNDETNCSTTKEITIDEVISFNAIAIDRSCNDATITVKNIVGGNATDGYKYAFIAPGDVITNTTTFYPFLLDTSTNELYGVFNVDNTLIPNVGDSKSYDIYVKSNGCTSKKITKTVRHIAPVVATFATNGVNEPTCLGKGSMIVDITGGLQSYTVALKLAGTIIKTEVVNGTPATSTTPAFGTVSFLGLDAGVYEIEVTDTTGCTHTLSKTFLALPQMPKFLGVQTPNNKDCKNYDALTDDDKDKYILGGYMDTAYPPTPVDLSSAAYAGYSFEISIDNGSTWTSGYEVKRVRPNTPYHVIIRMRDTSTGKIVCREDLGEGKMPVNVIGLILKAEFSGDCEKGFSVLLNVTEGYGPFEFSRDDGTTWVDASQYVYDPVPSVTYMTGHTFNDLILGQEYKFVVRDKKTKCIKKNVGIPDYDIPVKITPTSTKDICFEDGLSSATGEMTFNVLNVPLAPGNITTGVPPTDIPFTWTLYKITSANPLGETTGIMDNAVLPAGVSQITIPTITGLTIGTYYLKIKVGGSLNPKGCEYASANVKIKRNSEIIAKLEKIRDVTCSTDGLLRIVNVSGGKAPYTYTITGENNIVLPTTLAANGLDVLIPRGAVTAGSSTAEISVIATDSNQCNSANTDNKVIVNVSQNPVIQITDSESCTVSNKSITVEVINKTISPPVYTYEYSLDGVNWTSETVFNASHTISGITTSGKYKVRVIDGSGCTSNIDEVTLEDALDFNLLNVKQSCDINKNKIKISDFKGSGDYTWSAVAGVGGTIPLPVPASGIITTNSGTAELVVNKNTSYAILVTDTSTGCKKTISIQTGEGLKPSFILTSTPTDCYDGSYAVRMDDNNTNLGYSIIVGTTAANSTGATYTANSTGDGYTFTTMDNTLPVNQEFIIRGTNSNLCFDDRTVTVKMPAKISMTDAVVTQFSCAITTNTSKKAVISITGVDINGGAEAIAGNSPYTMAKLFKLDSSGGSAYVKAKNLPVQTVSSVSDIVFELDEQLYAEGGDFFVRVYDYKGCYGDSSTFTIDEFDALKSLNYEVLQATNCAGKEKIKVNFVSITNDPTKVKVTVTPNGGTAIPLYTPYVVELDKATSYVIKVVHDITKCELTKTHTFSQTPRVILSTTPSSVTCNGDSDGSVAITVDNYTGTDYNYVITGPMSKIGSSTTPTFTVTGLQAGIYTLTLKLSEYSHKIGSTTDCGEEVTFTIGEPNQAIDIAVTSTTHLTCKDSNDGKLEYIATNGAGGPYEYKVELLSGDPSLAPVTVVNVLTGTVVPGTPPTTTVGYGTETSLSDLLPGFYRITAKDNSGCENQNEIVEIENQTDITGTIGNFACSNGTATKVTVTAVNGGTPGTGYTYVLYSITDLVNPLIQQSGNEFLISDAGEYSIKVKDVNGCFSSDYMKYNGSNTFIINEKLVVELAKETDVITCSDKGLATVKITSGSGNYTYTVTNLQDNTTQTGTINVGSGTTNGAASFTFDTAASAGIVGDNYSVLVIDNVSTCDDTKAFQVAPAITPTFSVTPVALTCSSSEYKVQLSSSTALTYTFILQTTPSATQFTGVVDVNNILTITKITGVTGVVTEDVTVIATDPVTGCSKEEVINVALLENLISPTVVKAQFVCAAGTNNKNAASLTLTTAPSGGAGAPYTAELWEVVGSTENRIDTKSANANTVFILNNPGTYYIKMYDSTNVCFVTSSQEVIAPFEALPVVSVNPVAGTISCDGKEQITLDWSEDTPTSPIQVTISATNGTFTQTFQTPDTNPISLDANVAPYIITTRNTVTDCTIVQTYTLSTAPTPEIYVTSANVDCKDSSTGSVVFDFADTYTDTYTAELFHEIAPSVNVIGTVLNNSVTVALVNADQKITGLTAGKYRIVVKRTDFPNCESEKYFEIKEPIDPLVVAPIATDLSCESTVDGKLSFSSTGGWGNYKYTVEKLVSAGGLVSTTIQTKSVQTEILYLAHGHYKVTVFDENGCSHSDFAEIKQPSLIDGSVDLIKADCSLIDTKVTFDTVTGGTPTLVGSANHYTYSIYNDFDDTLYAGPLTGAANTISFNINDGGKYYGKITDSKNCTKKLPEFTVYEKLTFEVLQETVATTCDASGKVRFKISGGKGTYTYTVQGASTVAQSVTTMITPYEGTFETDNNVDNQIYTVTVTDAGVKDASGNSCSISKPITIAPWSTPKFNVAETKPVCASDYYVLATDNSNLLYTASEVIPPSGTAKFDITMTPAGVFHVKKLGGVTNAATGIVRITGAFPISVGSSACPIDKDITVTFKEDISVPTLAETQFACTTGTNTSNYATIVVGFTTGANGPYTATLWKVNASDGTALNPSSAITSMAYVSTATFQVTDYTGGTYEVRMFDGTNVCSSNATVVINPFVELKAPSIQSVANTISCDETEEVNITWVKTSTGVQLDIVPGSGLTPASTDTGGVLNASVITNVILRAGDKVVLRNTVTGCELIKPYAITPIPYYTITVDKKDICNAVPSLSNGEATFSFIGTPTYDISNTANTYSYEVFKEVGGVKTGLALGTVAANTITGLPKGNYIAVVRMTAFPNCDVTKLFTIEEPQPLVFLTANGETKANHVLCNGDSNGSIEFIADGGWGSYTYEVTTPNGILSSTTTPAYNGIDTFITGLGIGTYTVKATDKNYCDVITTLEIKDPSVIAAGPLAIVDNCDVAIAAKVTVPNANGGLVSPGIDPNGYKYVLYTLAGTIYAGPQSTNEFNIADSGTYQIKVFNDKGCSSDFIKFGLVNQFTINDKLRFNLSESKSVTCNGGGEVTINVTSGSGTAPSLANYTIEVKEPATTLIPIPSFVALPSGTNTFVTNFNNTGLVYTVKVKDNNSNNGCYLEKTITVSDPALPYFTATENASDCFGSAYVAVLSNPNLDYTYTTTLTANVNGTVVTGATNGSMINNRIEVGQVNTSNAALNGTITITGTNTITGCSIDVPLIINIPAKVNVITKPAIQFNCAVSTPANNTVESAKVQAEIAPADVASFSQAILYKVGTGVNPDIFMDIKPITSVDVSFDVTDYAGGDYYISLYKGSCATNTTKVTIDPFAPLNSYTLQVIDATDCAGMETIQITPATGTTISVKDKTGTSAQLVTGFTDQYIVEDDSAKYPYNVTVSNGTACELVGTYIPGPKKAYVLDTEITQGYCAPITGTDADGNPIYGIAKGDITFNFASYTEYKGAFSYQVQGIAGTTYNGTLVNVVATTGTHLDNSVTGLEAGKYQLVLKLSPTGCEVTSDFEIVSPAAPLTFGYDLNAITCDADKANMTINTTGGGIPYKYMVTKAGGISVYDGYDNYLQGLEDDTYDITVTDIYGCSVSKTLSITKPSPILATKTTVDNSCYGNEGGTITVNTPIGGIQNNANYWYILEYPSGVQTAALTTNVFTGLSAGKYNVYVVGDGGCKSTAIPVVLIDPAEGELTTEFLSGVGCDAAHSKAKIKVKASSVAGGPYDIYMLDGSGAVVNTVTSTTGEEEFDLAPNAPGESYTFYAEDANGCFTNISKYSVAVIEDLVATRDVVKGKVSCHDSNDGIVVIQATGGVGTRNYTLLKGGVPVVLSPVHNPESNQFTDLGVGTYTVKVTTVPDLGCVAATLPFDITGPKKLELDIINVVSQRCVGVNEGEIHVKGKGGYVNADGTGYKYTISSDAPGRVRNSGDFTNLEPGDYVVTLFDINGRCPVSSGVITIKAADVVTGVVANILQKQCFSDNEPSFEVKLSGGTAPYFVSINENGTFIEIPNGGDTYNFTAIDNIKAGKAYNVYAKDSRNCKAVQVDRVVFVKTIELGLQVDPVVYDCNTPGKSLITASVSDKYVGEVEFTLWAVDPSGGVDIDMETNEIGKFVNMPTGEYYVTVKQKLPGTCIETWSKFELNNITDNLEFTVDTSQMNTLIVNAVGGLESYEYSFDGGITFTSNNTFSYSESKDYDILVRDARGCVTSDIITGKFDSIIIPNYFTPDGDSINDYWYPRNVRTYHNLNVTIFDRYSREIKDFKGAAKGWDGKYNGKPLPRGDYWYRIRYTELTGSIVDKVGNFTLYRKD